MEGEKRQLQVRVMGACKTRDLHDTLKSGQGRPVSGAKWVTTLCCKEGVFHFREFSLKDIVNSRQRESLFLYYLSQ